MVVVEGETDIAVAPERVIEALATAERLLHFTPEVTQTTLVEAGAGTAVVDMTIRIAVGSATMRARLTWEPSRIEVRQLSGPVKAFRAEYVLSARGDGTRLHKRIEADPGTLGLLLGGTVERVLTNYVRRELADIKAACEAET